MVRPQTDGRALSRILVLAMFVVVAVFLASDFYIQRVAGSIDRDAFEILDNGLPSVAHLSRAAVDVSDLRDLAHDVSTGNMGDPAALHAIFAQRLADLEAEVAAYQASPAYPGELRLSSELTTRLEMLEASAHDLLGTLDGSPPTVRAAAERVRESLRLVGDSVAGLVQMNLSGAAENAHSIRKRRSSELRLVFGLDGIAALMALAATLFALYMLRVHDRLLAQRNRLAEQRAAELDLFAGRVAHDLVSPLQTPFFALEAGMASAQDAKQRDRFARALASLGRVRQVVDGLLQFARAGAEPDRSAATEVRPVIEGILTERETAAREAGITMSLEMASSGTVACPPGVLVSVLSNLVNNAIKYIGDGPDPRITLRTVDRGAAIEFDVEDTGPGLPADMTDRVFDLYVRAPDSGKPGLGIGLATVKRLVEAYGGRVGVTMARPRGTRFWFELPRARPSPGGERTSGREAPVPRPT